MTDLGPAGVYYDPEASWQSWGHGRALRSWPSEGPPWRSALSDKQRREMREYVRYESQFCRSAGCGFRHRPGVTPCLTAAALEEQDAIRREESSRRRAATAAEDAKQSKEGDDSA